MNTFPIIFSFILLIMMLIVIITLIAETGIYRLGCFSWIRSVSLVIISIFEALSVILNHTKGRKSIIKADNNHIHHKLLKSDPVNYKPLTIKLLTCGAFYCLNQQIIQ